MQALILAAGFGKRLKPYTDKAPKALVEVNGVPLLINALNALSRRGIAEVVVVVGHMRDVIRQRIGTEYRGMKITYVENPLYRTTNNIYSLYLARDYLHDDLILLECDLFYPRELIDSAVSAGADCGVLVSRYNPVTMDGTAVSADENGNIKMMYINRHQGPGFDYSDKYKTVNIYVFKKDFLLKKYLPAIETYVRTQSPDSYYEMALGALIYFGNDDIRIVEVDENQWCEIDNKEDLERAERRFPASHNTEKEK